MIFWTPITPIFYLCLKKKQYVSHKISRSTHMQKMSEIWRTGINGLKSGFSHKKETNHLLVVCINPFVVYGYCVLAALFHQKWFHYVTEILFLFRYFKTCTFNVNTMPQYFTLISSENLYGLMNHLSVSILKTMLRKQTSPKFNAISSFQNLE